MARADSSSVPFSKGFVVLGTGTLLLSFSNFQPLSLLAIGILFEPKLQQSTHISQFEGLGLRVCLGFRV